MNSKERAPLCPCGKVSFSKRDAQTKKNWLEQKGRISKLRIYPCPQSNTWHITKLINKNPYHEK